MKLRCKNEVKLDNRQRDSHSFQIDENKFKCTSITECIFCFSRDIFRQRGILTEDAILKESIKSLLTLQGIDNKLDEIERAKGDLPERVRLAELEVETVRHNLKKKEEAYKAIVSDRRRIEGELTDLAEAKKKYDEQLYAVKTNKEYDAVTLEIENTVAKIDENENLEIELLDKEEVSKKEVDELIALLAETEKKFADRSAKLKETEIRNADKEKALKAERDKVSGEIKVQFLRIYERIRVPKGGIALTSIHRGACGGCYTQMPPQRIIEVRESDKLIICEHCGRILYWADEEEITIN